jgi:DNA-binding transcriptional regulator YiaG
MKKISKEMDAINAVRVLEENARHYEDAIKTLKKKSTPFWDKYEEQLEAIKFSLGAIRKLHKINYTEKLATAGDNLKKLRLASKMTQHGLSKKLKIRNGRISKMECGEEDIPDELAVKLYQIFNVDKGLSGGEIWDGEWLNRFLDVTENKLC